VEFHDLCWMRELKTIAHAIGESKSSYQTLKIHKSCLITSSRH
jgi:hypothetical protein